MLFGYTWPRIRDADGEVAVHAFDCHAHLARIGELDCIANEIEEHLVRCCSSRMPMGRHLTTSVLSSSLLFWASDSVAELTECQHPPWI